MEREEFVRELEMLLDLLAKSNNKDFRICGSGNTDTDRTRGDHCDVLVHDGRAFIYYFCHASGEEIRKGANPNRTVIQIAELKLDPGTGLMVCNRNEIVTLP